MGIAESTISPAVESVLLDRQAGQAGQIDPHAAGAN